MSKLSDECTNEILVHISSIYSGKRENPIYWEYRDKSNSLLSKSLPMFTNLQVFKKYQLSYKNTIKIVITNKQ